MKRKVLPVILLLLMSSVFYHTVAQPLQKTNYDWIKYARIFILDGHSYPLYPKIEFDAEKLAETMEDMHANVVRIVTNYTTGCMIPGTEFKTSKDLGNRDLLAECIAASKPKGIKVVPYLGTQNSIITSLIDPEWAQKSTPEGDIPEFWDAGGLQVPTCWNTPYRQAFYDLVKHIMANYDIDGIYFDAWKPFYNFQGKYNICYCEGCTKGFRESTGREIPYHRNNGSFSQAELEIISQYHKWYKDEMFEAFSETKRIIKAHKDIPLIFNINNPERILNGDLRIINGTDAFMYERGRSMIERAEGGQPCYSPWPHYMALCWHL